MEGEGALEIPDDPRDPHLESPLHVPQQHPNNVHEPPGINAITSVADATTTAAGHGGAGEGRGDPGLHLQQLLARGHHVAL